MEMAAAHGLAQRLAEMTGLDYINRNEVVEFLSEEDQIINSWFVASNQIFRKVDFFYVLRRTLLFVMTNSPLKEQKKKELLKAVSIYFNTFSNVLKNNMNIRKPVIDIILDPWKNIFFSWDELFQKKISLRDQKVQEYFCGEPEDIVMARVHVFLRQGKEDMAMTLAKSSFFFHSRIAKHFSSNYQQYLNQNKNTSLGIKYKQGTASMDWYLFILQKRKNLPFIVNEMKQLNCHEGIMMIQRLRKNKKNESFAFTLLQILFMHELVRSSKFCCTKKIFYLWCLMHKEKNTSMDNILQEVRKMVATYAPSSAHFYLLVDALWNQFGSSFITVYVELYVRGLTVDINHLEAAKNGEIHEDVVYLECHIASMFAKLSTLFSDFHEGAARECMFSAFSLKPTKERLYILQSLTHSILSTENEMKIKSSLNGELASFQECKCVVKCSGLCKSTKEYFLEHPILMKGISNVPYAVVKDLVSVLEGVRCISFQYNLFDWRNNAIDLGDYLKDFNLAKSWESDTEYASEGSIKSDIEENPINDSLYQSSQIHIEPSHQSVKRKSESDNMKEIFTSNAGSNIELTNNEFVNKKIKVQEEVISSEVSKHNIFNASGRSVQSFRTIGMEDAIENVIRMTLDCNRQKSNIPPNSCHNTSLNTSLNHANDGTKSLSLSSAHKPVAENHVYPYSLTNYGKTNNLNSGMKAANRLASMKSSIENTTKYPPSFTSKHSTLSQALTAPIVSRESVISPAMNKTEKLISMQEQSYKQMAQNKLYSSKTTSASCYSMSNDDPTSAAVNPSNNVSLYHQEVLNLGTKNNQYDQIRNTPNRITQSSQFISNQTMQVAKTVHHNSDISAISEASNSHFISNASVASSTSMKSPINLSQTKKTIAAQRAGYPSSSQSVSKLSSVFRSDPRYNNNMSNTVMKRVEQSVACFQDNNLVHCDRSSVIQHTMQHSGEGHMQHHPNNLEMPNQLSVSLNSNAVEQIRSVPRKEITNLPPFTVNVNDRSISNSSVAVSANLVIPRKPQAPIDLACQAISSSATSVNNSETITIPGILASQSVIVSPWEQQRKNHGEYKYTKNINSVNPVKSEHKGARLKVPADKTADIQAFKAATYPNLVRSTHPTLPSSNQSNPNTSQIWSHVNNLSSQRVSQPTSSQPWYSEPYPKPNTSNISSKSSENLNRTVQQNISSVVKTLKLSKRTVDVSPHTIYSKPRLPSNSSISSTLSYSPNSSVSSSASSSVLNNSSIYSSSNSNARTMSNENILHKDFIPHASSNLYSNRANIKTYSGGSNKIKKNSVELPEQQISSMQLTADTVQYATPDVLQASILHSLVSRKDLSSCCSPSEVNPCQNCSLPAENNLMN